MTGESGHSGVIKPGTAFAIAVGCGVVVGVADCVGLIIYQLLYRGKANPNHRLMRLYGPLGRSSSGDSGSSGLAPKGYMIPLLTVGSHGVGKTTLSKAFINGDMTANEKPTYGTDLLFKTAYVDDQKAYVQIWEARLLGDCPSLDDRFPRAIMGCIMVYSVCHSHSFEAIRSWRKFLVEQQTEDSSEKLVLAVLGNSLPLEEGTLASDPLKAGPSLIDSVETFCHENDIPHFLMGAPDDIKMVKEAFMFVVSAALRQAIDKERRSSRC